MSEYLVYDVFTDTPFGGNQLAVFPDATALPEERLQSIAAEFNFSEVTFCYPPAANGTARVRIFTPTMEVPFAGHPTIGTAIALHDLGHPAEQLLELGVGPIPVRVDANRAAFTTRVPLERLSNPDATLCARCLSLSPQQVIGTPVQASLGLPFTFVELADRAALAACETAMDGFKEGQARYPGGLDFAIFAYTRSKDHIAARMFAPLDNIPEDPATGSASATLGALLGAGHYDIRQGEDMGRPSRITVEVAEDGAVTVSGHAVKVMQGRLLA